MLSGKRSDQVFGGVLLIGLAVLFVTGYWFPGILFVIGAASLARTNAEGKALSTDTGAIIMIIIGVFFGLDALNGLFRNVNWMAIALLLAGVYLLFGNRLRR